MQVGMMLKRLSPGMKQAKEADPGAQALRVGGDLEQGLGSRSKQQVIDDSFVLQRQQREMLRQGKDHMEILDGQQFISARLHPLGSGCGLAFGAMAITTSNGELSIMKRIVFAGLGWRPGSNQAHCSRALRIQLIELNRGGCPYRKVRLSFFSYTYSHL